MHTIAFALAAYLFPTFAAAQYGPPPPPPPTSTSSSPPTVPSAPADTPGHMNIDVAFQGTFTFHPNNITAPIGTLVTFWFPDNGLSHSVTQSSFGTPCTYLAASGNSSAGFDSGLQTAKQFTINITDNTKPIWFHCKQILHCGMGMVGSINAPSTGNTFDNFLAAAKIIGPSEVTEPDQGPVTGGVNAIATAPPSAGTGDSISSTVASTATSIAIPSVTGSSTGVNTHTNTITVDSPVSSSNSSSGDSNSGGNNSGANPIVHSKGLALFAVVLTMGLVLS